MQLGLNALAPEAWRGHAKEILPDVIHLALTENEDMLTLLFFEKVRYLPSPVAWRLLIDGADLIRGCRPRPLDGQFSVSLWPTYDDTAGGRVLPDVVFEMERRTIAVEVKWSGRQTSSQLDRQFNAVTAHVRHEVVMLALGGLQGGARAELSDCVGVTVLALDWHALHAQIRHELRADRVSWAERNVLTDMMSILSFRSPLIAREPSYLDTLPDWPIEPALSWQPAEDEVGSQND